MRFLLMIAVAGGIVFGILKFRDRLDRMYGRYFDKESKIEKGASLDEQDGPTARTTGQFLRASRPEIVSEVMVSLAINPQCRNYVADLERLDLASKVQGHYALTYQQLPVKTEDCAFNDPSLVAVVNSLNVKCRPLVSPGESISENCAAALFMTRAAMTKQLYATRTLSSITDMKVLTDLMFAEFSTLNNQTLPDLKRAKAVADRMLDLNPNLYVAAKVVAFAEVIDGLNLKARKPSMTPEEWTSARHAVARAKELNPHDESLMDAQMLVETRGFEPKLAVSFAEQLIADNGANPKAYYIKAYALWKLGDRRNALANLKQATTLAPDNRHYSQTYAEASRPNARADAFKGSITFGVDAKDFDK
jgi:tetratricopeptide (TPR) repeat protein